MARGVVPEDIAASATAHSTARDDVQHTIALKALNDALATDDRFGVVMLTIGDGVTLLEKR